jgi:nitrogen fixation NifU-like protein
VIVNESIYKAVLLDHFHNPRNKGELDSTDVIRRGSNPRCGDDIEVGISCKNETLQSVRFRGRGCSICLASASIMSECTTGLSLQKVRLLIDQMQQWFGDKNAQTPSNTALAALGEVRKHPARKKCVLLAWQALSEALTGVDE